MKFIYRLFWTMSIMSWMLFLYMLKNIQSTGFEIACILVGFFVVVSPLIAIFFAKHLSRDCISECSEIECADRKCVLVICWISLIACITDTQILFWMNFAAFFCFAVSNRNDVFSSNADPFRFPFLQSQNG